MTSNKTIDYIQLGDFIEPIYEKNSACLFGEDDAIGVNIEKVIRPMKGNLDNKKFDTFFIVRPKSFVYNPRGSRKLGLGYNDTSKTYITTFNNVLFRVKPEKERLLIPEYLYLYLSRKEWDREAEYRSWGSSTEVFSWSTLCSVKIPLPSMQVQQNVVDCWRTIKNIKDENEILSQDLFAICQSYIQDCIAKYPRKFLSEFISESDKRNSDSTYDVDSVRGVSIQKIFIPTKADMTGVPVTSYKIVENGDFAFNPNTARMGDKFSIALNQSPDTYLVSSIYPVFHVSSPDLDPSFLKMWFDRKDFDRYARFHSWGSAREMFNFSDMQRVSLPIPPIKEQKSIVSLYQRALESKAIFEEADDLAKRIAPILLQQATR